MTLMDAGEGLPAGRQGTVSKTRGGGFPLRSCVQKGHPHRATYKNIIRDEPKARNK